MGTHDGGVADGGEDLLDVGEDGLRVLQTHCGAPVALARSASQHYCVDVGDDVAGAEEPHVLQPRRSEIRGRCGSRVLANAEQ